MGRVPAASRRTAGMIRNPTSDNTNPNNTNPKGEGVGKGAG